MIPTASTSSCFGSVLVSGFFPAGVLVSSFFEVVNVFAESITGLSSIFCYGFTIL
jgi:hypothetical protein